MQPNTSPIGHNSPPSDAEILQSKLTDKHEKILSRADELVSAADRIPEKCDDDITAGKIGDIIKQMTAARKSVEAERVSEKEPFLSMGRLVDGFFKTFTDKLDKAKIKAQRPLDDYLKRLADAERQRRLEEAEKLRKEAEEIAAAAITLEGANMQNMADTAMAQATITEQRASDVAQSAFDKPAGMAQSRGVGGSLASLRTIWVGEIDSREAIDLEKLRAHIPLDALQKALNAFVNAGGRELAGARIFEKSSAVVR